MAITPIEPANAAPPLAPYSSATRAGNTLYLSGILPIGQDGRTVGIGDVAAQTRHVLDTIGRILNAAGASFKDIAFNQIFLKDAVPGEYPCPSESPSAQPSLSHFPPHYPGFFQ